MNVKQIYYEDCKIAASPKRSTAIRIHRCIVEVAIVGKVVEPSTELWTRVGVLAPFHLAKARKEPRTYSLQGPGDKAHNSSLPATRAQVVII